MNNNQAKTNSSTLQPGYKQTKLGWIPEEWEVKKLSEIFTFKNGVNASKEDYGKGVKFINVSEIFNNNYITASIIPGSVAVSDNVIKKYAVKRGDVLFNRTSETQEEIAFTAVYLDDEEVVFGGFVIRGSPLSGDLDNEFKKFCFQNTFFRKQVMAKGQGAVRVNIGQNDLGAVKIPLPPLPEQKKIATILSTWDAAIRTLDRLIERKQTLKKGLMQQLLTGQRRFPEFVPAGGTRYRETKLGLVPEDWEVVRLGKLVQTFSGGTPKSTNSDYYAGNIPWIRSGELNSRRVTQTGKHITQLGLSESSAKIIEPNTLLLALYGATAGVVSVSLIKAAINQAILAIIPKQKINQDYLETFLKWFSPIMVHRYTQGGQPNLSATNVKSQLTVLPSQKEQKKIANLFSNCNNEIEKLKSKKLSLEKQKKGLMQQLLTGAVRVKP